MFSKILRVKTTGSRATGNLHPIIADHLPVGVNLKALEYDEAAGEAIVEIWGSDHPLMRDKTSVEVLKSLSEHDSVLEKLKNHPHSGGYRLVISAKAFEKAKKAFEHLPPVVRTETVRGRKIMILEER